MRDVLSSVLVDADDDASSDRVLAAAFFRKRPLQAGVSAEVIPLSDRITRRTEITMRTSTPRTLR